MSEQHEGPHEEAANHIASFLRSEDGKHGEVPYADIQEMNTGQLLCTVLVQWWSPPPRWREIRDIVRAVGGTSIKIMHALYDEDNEEEDGAGPCGASLEVTFCVPNDGINAAMKPYVMMPLAVDAATGELVTAEEAIRAEKTGRA
jgi:hypothetical protein